MIETTPLGNGRILVVGGVDQSTTELYDPPTGMWIPGGTLNEPHWGHLAVRLADGRVLVAGGGRYSAGAELYDPATNSWTPTGSMNVGRISFTGTLLRDGRVLVGGGPSADGTVLVAGGSKSSGWLRSAELYDPSRGRWTRAAPMTTAREGASATLLGDGRVLVAGGATRAQPSPPSSTTRPRAGGRRPAG